MTRNFLLSAAVTVLFVGTVSAQFQGPSDTTEAMPSTPAVTPVIQVKAAADDTIVKMNGYIIRQVDSDEYDFADKSDPTGVDRVNNVIKVEIADSVFQGVAVTPATEVLVYGKRDKETNDDEVDVYILTKVGGPTVPGSRGILSVEVEEGGVVTTSPPLFRCIGPSTCQASVQVSLTVTLTATPNAGWEFDDWDGCDQETEAKSGGTCTKSISTQSNLIKAEFDPK